MSQREFDTKFPGQRPSGLPPSPSRENPGRVYPKTDPNSPPIQPAKSRSGSHLPADQAIGNPFLMKKALDRVDDAFTDVISILEQEERAQNPGGGEFDSVGTGYANGDGPGGLLEKIKGWRDELSGMRLGRWSGGGGQGAGGFNPANEPGVVTQEGGMFAD